jgi:hypothetical protein
MPINWNEVDRLKLEYIQNKEAIEAEYRKECLACENSFFKFRKPERPKELYSYHYFTYKLYEDQFISVEGDKIIPCFLSLLPEDLKTIVFEYLNLNVENYLIDKDTYYRRTYYYIDDTDENRKKIDKVVTLIEKYLKNEEAAQETKQKEAEAFIDNYINGK